MFCVSSASADKHRQNCWWPEALNTSFKDANVSENRKSIFDLPIVVVCLLFFWLFCYQQSSKCFCFALFGFFYLELIFLSLKLFCEHFLFFTFEAFLRFINVFVFFTSTVLKLYCSAFFFRFFNFSSHCALCNLHI